MSHISLEIVNKHLKTCFQSPRDLNGSKNFIPIQMTLLIAIQMSQ